MIDTIEFTTIISSTREFYTLLKKIDNLIYTDFDKKRLYPRKIKYNWEYYSTTAFIPSGFLELAFITSKTPYYQTHVIKLKFKPALIIYPNDSYALLNFSDLDRSKKIFENFIEFLNDKLSITILPKLVHWNVTRIDYATQFSTEYYKEYLALLRKGNIPAKSQKLKKAFPSSVVHYGQNTNINIYDKTVQKNDIDNKHILRIEVQCKAGYLKHLKEHFHWNAISLDKLWDPQIAKKILLNKISSLIGREDFFNFDNALVKIDNIYSCKKAEKLANLLKISSHHKTNIKAIPILYNNIKNCKKDYAEKNLLPSLKKININLLIIPTSWKIPYLINPYKIIEMYFLKQ